MRRQQQLAVEPGFGIARSIGTTLSAWLHDVVRREIQLYLSALFLALLLLLFNFLLDALAVGCESA